MQVKKNRRGRQKKVMPEFLKSKINQLKKVSLGWSLLFFVIIATSLISGINPLKKIVGFIRADNKDTRIINLYAHSVQNKESKPGEQKNCWNQEQALFAPEQSPDDAFIDFSDQSSSFCNQGGGELIFGNFLPLQKENNNDINEEKATTSVELSEDIFEREKNIDILPTFQDIDKAASSTQTDLLLELKEESNQAIQGTSSSENFLSEEGSSTEIIIFDDSVNEVEILTEEVPAVEKIEIETENYSEETGVEVPEDGYAEETNNAEEEDAEEEHINEDFSAFNFSFGTTPALAQEVLMEQIDNLSELGEFKFAQIKMSLARREKIIKKQNNLSEHNIELIETLDDFSDLNFQKNENELTNEAGLEQTASGTLDLNQIKNSEVIIIDEETKERASSSEDQAETSGSVEAVDNEDYLNTEDKDILETEAENDLLSSLILPARAQTGGINEDKLVIWYSLGGKSEVFVSSSEDRGLLWQQLDTVSGAEASNALNGGYFSFAADFLQSWEDVNNLKIRVEVLQSDEEYLFYLDSLWLETEYIYESELDKLKKRQRWEEALDLLSKNTTLKIDEQGELKFRYNKNEERIWDTLGEIIGWGNFWKKVDLSVELIDNSGKAFPEALSLVLGEDGGFEVFLSADNKNLRPGKYYLKFHIEDKSGEEVEIFDINQDFYWGVLAVNTDKDVYSPGDKAYLQMAVLDVNGHTICDAETEILVLSPDGKTNRYFASSSNPERKVYQSELCGAETVSDKPDYYLFINLDQSGEYSLDIKVNTLEGRRRISKNIKVAESDLIIEREAATRIYPKSEYEMSIVVNIEKDFFGDIYEYLPGAFKIINYDLRLINNDGRDARGEDYRFDKIINEQGELELRWQDIELLSGDKLLIKYRYDAPDISPELYLIGPIHFFVNKEVVMKEKRSWQIASDAVNKRARTVQFFAGAYNGGASIGQNTNVDQSFSAFNFLLAETGVDIKNAFVVFEAQIEAYANGSENYDGYQLAFDACEENCTANAWSGTNRVRDVDNSILAYNETESNAVRLLIDVSSEAQLAAYTGAGLEMEAQFGYRIEKNTSSNSIANAKAILIVSYTYDADSPNITNTVVYPLDSTNGTDSGTRQSSRTACTRNNNCPIFDYEMDIPEFPGTATSSQRLSQWFKMFDANDGNNSNDMDPNVNIQTYDIDSASFHHECVNAGTQGNMPTMLFADWTNSGYSENSSQQLEYYVNSGTNYVIGGEVYETYIASSSTAVKTRTVSFPLGVINNGDSTSLSSKDVSVYFPENGTATSTVKIKSAWLRLITHNHNSAVLNMHVSSKVGSNATSSDWTYNYNGGGAVIKPVHSIVHIIPSGDYGDLGEANEENPVNVRANTTYSNLNYGGVSAELMITYTYSSEQNGYLSSLRLFGGQSKTNPATSSILSTANTVFPEANSKTILAGGLLASFLNSDSGASVGAGTVFYLDAGLATTSPSCGNSFEAEPDDINSFSEFYKEISASIETIDNQSYQACYNDDESLTTTDGAKVNGILSYTYGWKNNPPTGVFNSAIQKVDGTGVVDISIEIDDANDQDIRAKIDYATGTACVFSSYADPSLDESDGNITADHGDPDIENNNTYQIGVSGAYILTASGTNTVNFDWQSHFDLSSLEGNYCLRLRANDLTLDQAIDATTTVYIDNINPSASGALSLASRTGATTTLLLGANSTETNFKEYKIFYKIYDGSNPTEADSVWASSSDTNLGNILFNLATTTAIGNLSPRTFYSFAIWTYDLYGNKASSSRVDIETNDAPTGVFNSAVQKIDGSGVVDISIEADDLNNDDTLRAKIEYSAGEGCNFGSPLDPSLDTSSANIQADFGSPVIDNTQSYQVGSSTGYILTSPGSNTLGFDWLTTTDLPTADETYCLRLSINDGLDDQVLLATTSLVLDNVKPTSTASLISGGVGTNYITLVFATTTPAEDTNEPSSDAYKIFYKQGISGVSEADTEKDDSVLDAYDYSSATSTIVSGLEQNTWYAFNIWTYDNFGNIASATEIAIKTNATLSNDSLTFVNPETVGVDNNIVVGGTSEWIFRAVVTETNGWYAIASSTLRLADNNDTVSPFSDLAFSWDQSSQAFSEIGADVLNTASLSSNATSSCAGNTCTLDFIIIVNKNFASSSYNYNAELISGNDFGVIDSDNYTDFYQIRFPYVEQKHYRFRNDDGGE